MSDFLKHWFAPSQPDAQKPALLVLREVPGSRKTLDEVIRETVKDHLAGLDIIERIGSYDRALAYVRNKLPTTKRVSCSLLLLPYQVVTRRLGTARPFYG